VLTSVAASWKAQKTQLKKHEKMLKAKHAARSYSEGTESVAKKAYAAAAEMNYKAAAQSAKMKVAEAKHVSVEEKQAKVESRKLMKEAHTAARLPADEIPACRMDQCLNGTTCMAVNGLNAPFWSIDLIHCSDQPLVMQHADIGLEPSPPPSTRAFLDPAACKKLQKKCVNNKKCSKLAMLDGVAAIKAAACDQKKAVMTQWFALAAKCPDPKYSGLEEAVSMIQKQVESVPAYRAASNKISKQGSALLCKVVSSMMEAYGYGS
jgi:hypothetical protein